MAFNTQYKFKTFFSLFKRAMKGEHLEYTSGSINQAIVLLAIPMILEMMMESVFAVVDLYFVSQLGDNDALAAVGLTESILTIIYSLAFGLSMGATALVARRIGEKDVAGASESAGQAIIAGFFISVVVAVIGIFFSDDLLRAMGGTEAMISRHGGFSTIMLTGNITIVFLFIINGIFRGAGDASLAMKSLILANVLNIILDPIFIFGFGPVPALGVEGAAVATNIGRGVGVAFQVYDLARGSSLVKLKLNELRLRASIIWKLLELSAGTTGQFIISSASWIFLMRIMADFGNTALAGYLIGIRIIIFAILPAWGMANASATLVGQNLGAGEPERAEKSVWRAAFMNMVFLAVVTILFYTLSGFIVGFFSEDEAVLHNAKECLKVVSLGYVFYAYGMVISQAFNGAGDTRTPTLINVFGFWIFQIPLAYVLANHLNTGPVGVYAAIAIAESAMALVGIYIFRKGKWKLVKI